MKQLYTFRDYAKDDIPFIQNSWGLSYYHGRSYHRVLAPSVFHSYHRPVRERILAKEAARILVCCNSEDPTHILGWIATEETEDQSCLILHYLYVKHAFNGSGIGTQLVEKACSTNLPIYFTHMTHEGKEALKHLKLNWNYCPHLT